MNKTGSPIRRFVSALIRFVFLTGFAFVILYPVVTLVSKAFMHQQDLYDNTVLWIPKHLTLDNIEFAWNTMGYPEALGNSLVVVVATSLLQTISTMMAGYAFARFEFPLKKFFFAMVLLSIVLPPQIMMIPQYMHFKSFDFFGIIQAMGGKTVNLLGTPWPFFILSATGFGIRNGLFIYLFRQAFRAMPRETEEAALVDGANHFRVFTQIMVPNAVGIIATVLLFSVVWQWNDTFYSGLFTGNTKMLPQAFDLFNSYLEDFTGGRAESVVENISRYDLTDANVLKLLRNSGVFLIMTPLLAFYAVLQRFFVEGIERSGLVG